MVCTQSWFLKNQVFGWSKASDSSTPLQSIGGCVVHSHNQWRCEFKIAHKVLFSRLWLFLVYHTVSFLVSSLANLLKSASLTWLWTSPILSCTMLLYVVVLIILILSFIYICLFLPRFIIFCYILLLGASFSIIFYSQDLAITPGSTQHELNLDPKCFNGRCRRYWAWALCLIYLFDIIYQYFICIFLVIVL